MIDITVAYATPEKQVEIALSVEEPCTIAQAIALSGITNTFPEINLSEVKVGIFGKCAVLASTVSANDRVEIYRALHRDPKELRRVKVKHKG